MSPLPDAPPPYAVVAFDCDSTLSAIEGIDELARLAGQDVRALTEKAMRGEIALESVYAARLELVRPTRAMVDRVGALYVARMLPHARELVLALRSLGKRVCAVSGGLEPAVRALAGAAGIAEEDVHAVPILFDGRGRYAGFDQASPLARSGGKVALARSLGSPLAFVGDGVTDLEVAEAGACARFVAFGGVARRPEVLARASVRCEAPDLAALLPLLCSPAELETLARGADHAALLDAARRAGEDGRGARRAKKDP